MGDADHAQHGERLHSTASRYGEIRLSKRSSGSNASAEIVWVPGLEVLHFSAKLVEYIGSLRINTDAGRKRKSESLMVPWKQLNKAMRL
jgi:hypothetical protein